MLQLQRNLSENGRLFWWKKNPSVLKYLQFTEFPIVQITLEVCVGKRNHTENAR